MSDSTTRTFSFCHRFDHEPSHVDNKVCTVQGSFRAKGAMDSVSPIPGRHANLFLLSKLAMELISTHFRSIAREIQTRADLKNTSTARHDSFSTCVPIFQLPGTLLTNFVSPHYCLIRPLDRIVVRRCVLLKHNLFRFLARENRTRTHHTGTVRLND